MTDAMESAVSGGYAECCVTFTPAPAVSWLFCGVGVDSRAAQSTVGSSSFHPTFG